MGPCPFPVFERHPELQIRDALQPEFGLLRKKVFPLDHLFSGGSRRSHYGSN